MPRPCLPLLAVAMIVAGGPALAQDGANRLIGLMLDRIDANGDGEMSQPEIAAARQTQFARIDRDGDGQLSQAELAAMQERLSRFARLAELSLAEHAARLDTDGDGLVSQDEYLRPSPFFTLIDADGNGALSRAEIDRARAAFTQTQ